MPALCFFVDIIKVTYVHVHVLSLSAPASAKGRPARLVIPTPELWCLIPIPKCPKVPASATDAFLHHLLPSVEPELVSRAVGVVLEGGPLHAVRNDALSDTAQVVQVRVRVLLALGGRRDQASAEHILPRKSLSFPHEREGERLRHALQDTALQLRHHDHRVCDVDFVFPWIAGRVLVQHAKVLVSGVVERGGLVRGSLRVLGVRQNEAGRWMRERGLAPGSHAREREASRPRPFTPSHASGDALPQFANPSPSRFRPMTFCCASSRLTSPRQREGAGSACGYIYIYMYMYRKCSPNKLLNRTIHEASIEM